MEDLLYESEPVRRFVGLKLPGPLPDETTILNFRHLLEKNNLGQGLLKEINAHLESQGLNPNPPKRWAVALTPGMMGKGRRTGQA